MLSANRGLCGGYKAGVLAWPHAVEGARGKFENLRLEVPASAASSVSASARSTRIGPSRTSRTGRGWTRSQCSPRGISSLRGRRIDRLDIVYTKFESLTRQYPVSETLLPIGDAGRGGIERGGGGAGGRVDLRVPALGGEHPRRDRADEFPVQAFQCFLDAAVSEQVARMLAMKAATENADQIIAHLTMTYNRARQARSPTSFSK